MSAPSARELEGSSSLAKRKGNSLAYRVTCGAPPSDHLISGEVVKWQGKPAAAIILGRGLHLTIFGLIYLISMVLFFKEDHDNLLAVGIGAIACNLMIVERRLGLIGGMAGLAIATWSFLAGSAIAWYWFLVPLAFALLSLLIDYIYLSRVLFVITDRRIISRYGVFTLRYADTGIDKVQNGDGHPALVRAAARLRRRLLRDRRREGRH